MAAAPARRGRGRPRSEEASAGIVQAVRELLAEGGFGAVTVEAVAERAGVGLNTIYRRWKSKEDLVADVVFDVTSEQAPILDTGDLRTDLIEMTKNFMRVFTSELGRVYQASIAEGQRDPEWATRVAEIHERRRANTRQVVLRGIERGELPKGTDPDMVLDILAGVLWQRLLVSHKPFEKDLAERLVDVVLHGARAGSPRPRLGRRRR